MLKSLFAAIFACALLGPTATAGAATFHVDTKDELALDNGAVTCPSPCSLRQAITASNNTPATDDIIDFNLGTSGVQTINVGFGLPGIIDNVTIDGTTEPGWSTSSGPLVEISGNAPNGAGLVVEEPTIVKGLIINHFPNAGIATMSFSTHVGSLTITGSYIGTNAAGTGCAGNGGDGIALGTASQSTIGGTAAGDRNVIACNTGAGVSIASNVDQTTVQGSYIGLLANGLAGSGQTTGVHAQAPSALVRGGPLRNVISGNAQDGVLFDGGAARDSVDNSLIGTDPTGTAARPNGRYGINISGDQQGIDSNVIAGNAMAGIEIRPPAGDWRISDNNIGRGLPAGGGIGVALGGQAGPPLGNGGAGVELASGGLSLIGMNDNVIANNAGAGISVLWTGTGAAPAGINVDTNFFDANGGLGIDLGGDGVTPNDHDPATGPNGFQNYPVLTSVASDGGNTTIDGTLDSEPSAQFGITFFVSPSCDPSGYGEGASTSWPHTSVNTNPSGHVAFTFSFPGQTPLGSYVTATARKEPGSNPGTSEFSQCIRLTSAPVATTDAATAVGLDGATLHGTGDPHGLASTGHFEYGLTAAYGSSTTDQSLGSGVGGQAVSQTLAGLASGATFHYRLVVTNAKGTADGEDKTFTTASPGGNGGPPGGGTPDTTPPVLSGLTLTHRTFAVAKRKPPPKGVTIRFNLSEAASVKFAVTQKRPGRRKGKRCVAPTRKLQHAKQCTRIVTLGSFTRSENAGPVTASFSGRLGGRALKPGSYTLTLSPTDLAGNHGVSKSIKFTIVKR